MTPNVAAATKAAGFDNLKGHKSVGGLRASIYNAMPKEGVEALVRFLSELKLTTRSNFIRREYHAHIGN